MRTHTNRSGWLRLLSAAVLASGCTVDSNDPVADTSADAAAGTGGAPAPDAGDEGGTAAGGQVGAPDAASPAPDLGTSEPDAALPTPDAAADPCAEACVRFTDCAVAECEGYADVDAPALRTDCDALCLGNAAFATVVLGSTGCADVVEFGRARASAGDALGDFLDACAPPAPPPPEPDGSECRFACAEAEVCLEGHCVRPDGTCAGDIHCRTGVEICVEGRCVAAEFAPCRGDDACAADQFCLTDPGNPLAGGVCVYDCASGQLCPFHERCYPEYGGGACYYELCGSGYGNGDPLGACRVGGEAGYDGTCFPLPAESGAGVGICLEAGLAAEGAACDLQVEGRDPAARAVECAPGTYCWGDYDDAELPPTEWGQMGACAGLCDPGAPACSEGRTCVDLSNGDDPATPEDETRTLGICLPLECDLFPAEENDCPEHEACRLVAVTLTRGECGPGGERAPGEPCETADDCAGVAFCGQSGGEQTVCLALCDPAAAEGVCGQGQTCYAEPLWVVGFCIDTPAP